ncbi:hypothetical protein PN462_02555 [Spirulina sp. CS-785/01]|uniref:hypothetical protein n=1 Tax=Spirulina sp. CS-785/01 TaxID=3021716 RepID=UPI00232B19C9|nr:hypothetical protein [Spirulina sp. CS-785/01]MDB9311968.1 hypothetical protein [Spirulina sp. CS-785/01]
MNIFELGGNELIPVDYESLLKFILQEIQQTNPFNPLTPTRIIVKLDEVAWQVSRKQVANPISSSNIARSATLHFNETVEREFPSLIRRIRDGVRGHFQERLNGVNFDLRDFINPLNQRTPNTLNFAYNFPTTSSVTSGLETRENGVGSASLLKFHKVTISVRDINQFQEGMQRGVENHIEEQLAGDEEIEDAKEALEDLIERPNSDFNRLQQVVDTESLGKLKKEAKICYLEYLAQQIDREQEGNVIYLEDLIRRLRAIEDYINDPNKSDGDYEVSYGGEVINYRDWFSRAESLDYLPIIPIFSDSLGETTDDNETERTFTFGLKLKLGHPVQARGGKEVFDYYLDVLDPNKLREQFQESDRAVVLRKVLRVLFLYYFAFATRSNPRKNNYNIESELEYDIIANFDQQILPIFQGNDERQKQRILTNIIRGFRQLNIKTKIERLRELLQRILKRITIFSPEYFHREIGVSRGILEQYPDDLMQGHFFEDVVGTNPKGCLRYITIKDAHPSETTFCQLPVTLKFEDIRYYPTEEEEKFKIEYASLQQIYQLPILFIPNSELSKETSKKNLRQQKMMVFAYNNRHLDRENCDAVQGFIYRFTMSLLVYVTLRVILEEWEKYHLEQDHHHLFLPILRFHEGDSNHPSLSEEFMADLSKVVAHLLNTNAQSSYYSNSQGVRIKNQDTNKLRNAFSSLYSVLPQTFTFSDSPSQLDTTLDKLALIVVSSLESDGTRRNRDRTLGKSTLFGEVIGITNQQGKTQIQLRHTFSQNYSNSVIYRNPSILNDVVVNLHQKGYRHILYVAQAPYSNNLHLTQVQQETEFLFMSPTLIQSMMSGVEDMQIYPVFFSKYYVRKSKKLEVSSYTLQDTSNLLNLVEDPSQKVVVFFNLFNGITIGNRDERFYNGVMSYSTLLNIYQGVLDDQSIRQGLIYEGSLKDAILRYITLFHFFRLENSQNKKKLKLDPYEQMIGDDSLRKNSVFYHMDGQTYFNNLAFLTEVNSILLSPVTPRQEEE